MPTITSSAKSVSTPYATSTIMTDDEKRASIPMTKDGLRVGLADDAFSSSFRTYYPEALLIKDVSMVKFYDLIIFPGGADVDPKHYSAPNNGLCYSDPDRDEREMAIFKEADKLGIQMLGTCRGLQLINVGRGGTLYQDLRMAGKTHFGEHALEWVKNEKGEVAKSRLFSTFPGSVNSYHHQGIQRLGNDLVIVASHLGVPEIILGGVHIIAVQFHPEFMGKAAIPFFELITQWVMNTKIEKEEKAKESLTPAVAKEEVVKVTVEKKAAVKKKVDPTTGEVTFASAASASATASATPSGD